MADSDSTRFIRSHLKMRQLILLVELARHGSIFHAAKATKVTQPGASKLLAELEHVLGVPLFERLPRGVIPTVYGKVLIRRAEAALAEMDDAHIELTELRTGGHGMVNVGSVLTPSVSLIPKAINLLKSRQSGIRVGVTVDTSKLLVERLRAGELDLVVGRILDVAVAAELNFEPVADEPHSLIARAGHPWVNRTDLDMRTIVESRWIVPPAGSMLRDRLMELFLSYGLDQPQDIIETMALSAIPNLLIGSDAVIALPQELIRSHLDAKILTVLPFDLGLRANIYGIVTRKRHQLSPSAAAMLHALRDVVAKRSVGD